MKILVLGGGDSPEREVSIRSARAVSDAVFKAGYMVSQADPSLGLKFIDNIPKGTIVFPILHGSGGEDGVIQKILEEKNIPFLGSGSTSSELCFDKWATCQKLIQKSIPMPVGMIVSRDDYMKHDISKRPHVLKVVHGGSSIGTLIFRNPGEVDITQVDKLFELDEQAVLEELIEGVEITVGILDGKALPVIEIVPPPGEEFDYENRYNGQTQEICPPQNVTEEIQKKAKEISEKVHKIMGCRHYSRVDMMVDKQDNIYVLEINTIPGMTDHSLFPKDAKAVGMDMPTLVSKLVELVKRDYKL